ncbi:MAG: universal stress protein [Chloroflexota bacterium]
MIRRILVPLDGSKMAERILPHVEYLARLTNAELTLLCIAVPLQIYTDHVVTYPVDERAQLDEAWEYVADVAASLRDRGLRAEAVARYGNAADEIVNFAQEAGADLIAMSTHGRSGLGRWVFGSVAEKVLRASSKPILLLKPDGSTENRY